jgi:hypothetical protein
VYWHLYRQPVCLGYHSNNFIHRLIDPWLDAILTTSSSAQLHIALACYQVMNKAVLMFNTSRHHHVLIVGPYQQEQSRGYDYCALECHAGPNERGGTR